ncbi:MAG: GNAT family N-acetyltransferase [Rhodocyclaceae bacterium]|nr:GNAT family N-acetyltransferase [Rhodocyclaceae bacterium]MDZ4214436.1 GNAT family N-acetyltransferase [Rhodocyclaceae bacterium]
MRNARISDWPRLGPVAHTIFPELSDSDVSHLLRWHHQGTVVACHGRDIIGYYQIQPRGEPGVAWLNYLGVLPAWRGIDVAGSLLATSERHAKTCGFDSIMLDTRVDNVHAQHFYERNGYARRGEQTYAAGAKFRFAKTLAQTPALAQAMPALEPAPVFTRALRKLAYGVLMRWPYAGARA